MKFGTSQIVGRAATPIIALAISFSWLSMQSCGTSTIPIGFNPIHFEAIRLFVLPHVTFIVVGEAAIEVWRNGVDVWDDPFVCTGHIKIELD